MSEIRKTTYYGFPVFYRIEHRADGDVFVFSYRQKNAGQLRLEYEHPPRRVPMLERLLKKAESAGDWFGGDEKNLLEQLPEDVMDEFFYKFLDISDERTREVGIERRKSIPELTLGAIIAADRERLIPKKSETTGRTRSRDSIEDDIRMLGRLCQREGGTTWRDVTVQRCSVWLSKESVHMQKSCGRMMKRLLLPFFEMRIIDDLLGWENYDPETRGNHKPQYKGLVRSNILPNMLSYGQCRELLGRFVSPAGPENVSGVDMALLLKLTLGLDLEEICAMNIESFAYLNDFPERLTVRITHLFCKSPEGANYRIREIEDPYQRRILPLSRLATQCYTAIVGRRKLTGATPLVPSKKNSRRHMTPEDLEKELNERASVLFAKGTFSVEGVRVPTVTAILDNTAIGELRKASIEDEELRFIRGKRPLIVSAVSYADFLNEAELNKLGALQDRWLNRVMSAKVSEEQNTDLNKKGAIIRWTTPSQGSRTQIVFKIDFSERNMEEISKEGITLELHALHGFSGTISWSQNDALHRAFKQ